MLIKKADDQGQALEVLERLAALGGPEAKAATAELRKRRAGIKGERNSAYLIDFDYGDSPNWAVIHDLRLEHNGRTAQIDHLLINRWMEFFVLETKQFHAGVKITEEGEFLKWNAFTKHFEGMASPLQQNERHIAVLSDVVSQIRFPSRFGVPIAPTFNSLVLVAPEARIDRPEKLDTSRVIKADQLKPRIWRDLNMENPVSVLFKAATRMVSSDTVRFIAEELVARHTPTLGLARAAVAAMADQPGSTQDRAAPRMRHRAEAPTPNSPSPLLADPPAVNAASVEPARCKQCGSDIGSILHGKFGYYFKCAGCGGNTSQRFACQPGHSPRVRKDGNDFYRECPECDYSTLFHRNP